jgi:hypothetical protein
MTTSFTDDEILEGIRWSSGDPSMGPAELKERMAWTLARLMVERDGARQDLAEAKAMLDYWKGRAQGAEHVAHAIAKKLVLTDPNDPYVKMALEYGSEDQ